MTKHKFKLQYDYVGDAVKGQADGQDVMTAQNLLGEILGHPVKIVGEPGTTDASKFVNSTSAPTMLVVGPGNETVHQVNEYVDVDEYLAACEFYERFAKQYLD
ncbi:M20/M25/M40 family metallo-hydrolase [Lactobacillus sp. ESL0791]|uniref:M20/M25/M40 family metallo-hydrolase n=1 Tax=Lactobacillus sp. ESL0791 TaxID=2983234 RepID=UPI0023F8456B|nr:M20/M25/M40 family metallo-hydrolase [Lactobacillus sp. ESL0791]MDF7639005.1 M20/M25/M40 family metallo-hydrolase [Lactobacillus sp. ESL0791]